MELIVAAVLVFAVVLAFLWDRHGQWQREERLIAGLKELAYAQREPLAAMGQHVRELYGMIERQSEALVKIGELAPQKAQLEMRRMEFQFDVERTAAEAELSRTKLMKNVRETAPSEAAATIPMSQSTLE